MTEVLAINTNDTINNSCFCPEQRLSDAHDILTICFTRVSVTTAATNDLPTQTSGSEAQELRLTHYSVEEYLILTRLKKASMCRYHITPLSANVSIAKCFLINFLHIESRTILIVGLYDFPLARYAAEF